MTRQIVKHVGLLALMVAFRPGNANADTVIAWSQNAAEAATAVCLHISGLALVR